MRRRSIQIRSATSRCFFPTRNWSFCLPPDDGLFLRVEEIASGVVVQRRDLGLAQADPLTEGPVVVQSVITMV